MFSSFNQIHIVLLVLGYNGIQAYHARLYSYDRELSLYRKRYQSCFQELEVNKRVLEAEKKELSLAVARIVEFERCLADSEIDVRTLSDTFTRSDQEHAVILEKCQVNHDLALCIVSSNALQQGWEEGQQCGLAVAVKFYLQQILAAPISRHFLQLLQASADRFDRGLSLYPRLHVPDV